MFKCTKVITPGNSIIVSTLGSKSKSAPVNHPCLSSPGSGTTPLLLILSGPGPLYLRGEGPFTLALEQLMCYSPSVALDLYISGVRSSGTVPVLLTLSSPGPLYLQVRGHLLWLWNSSSITHPQWPWPSVSPGWEAAYSGSGTAPVLLTLSGPGPLYLWSEGPLTLALEQCLCRSEEVVIQLRTAVVRWNVVRAERW